MSSPRDFAQIVAAARQYAVDRATRSTTRSAFQQLARLRSDELALLVKQLSRSSELSEQALALLLASHLSSEAGKDALLSAFESDAPLEVLAAAAEAVSSRPEALWSQKLAALADRPESELRRAAASALYGRDDGTSFDALLRLAYDADDETRGWAAWALADGFPASEDRDRALRDFLGTAEESQLTATVRRALETPAGRDQGRSSAPRKASRSKSGRHTTGELVVLVASANPYDTTALALDEEVREITASLRATPARDVVTLQSGWAMRPRDLLHELNERRPAVLHFSGHGMADGHLVFADQDGSAKPVSGEAIAATIASAGESVRVVVLNACFSAALATALTQHVDVAVGMNRPIGDIAARVFAEAFYSALGYGSSVGRAFDQGRAALLLEGIPEDSTPQLLSRDGVDPYELVLVDPRAVRTPDANTEQAALVDKTDEHLSHLERHSLLPIAGGVSLERTIGSAITTRAKRGSLLVLGEPGSGKTGALYRFARDAQEADQDVVVISADLLAASGRRGLSEELGLELDLVDVLAAWTGDEPGYLVIDALDAARGRESAGVLLDLIERVASRAGRWRVIASVRSFDLRHNQDLQAAFPLRGEDRLTDTVSAEFVNVRHVHVSALSDDELEELSRRAPDIGEFIASSPPRFRDLARVPFNLRLVASLLQRAPVELTRLRSLETQLELLDLYWAVRVREGHGQDARELLATLVCERALDVMRLQVPRRTLRVEAAQTSALDELLREGVLVETANGPRGEDSVGFAHHVLFDYAVHLLLLAGGPEEVAAKLVAHEDLVLLARPSLMLTLAREWAADDTRSRFWNLALFLASPEVPVGGRIAAPATAIDEARSLSDLQPLVAALDREEPLAAFLLGHTVGARITLGTPGQPLAGRDDLELWADFAGELSVRITDATAYPLRLLVWGLWAAHDRLERNRSMPSDALLALCSSGHGAKKRLHRPMWESDWKPLRVLVRQTLRPLERFSCGWLHLSGYRTTAHSS